MNFFVYLSKIHGNIVIFVRARRKIPFEGFFELKQKNHP